MAATTWIPAPALPDPAARSGTRLPAPARPALRVLAGGRRGRVLRWTAVVLLVAALAVGTAVRAAGADAPVAAGHVVLAPGETLWDLAIRTADPGVDPRAQLRDLLLLNDLDPAAPPAAWTVVLLPAR